MKKIKRIIEILKKADKEDGLPIEEVSKQSGFKVEDLEKMLPIFKKEGIVDVIFKKWQLAVRGEDRFDYNDEKIMKDIKDLKLDFTENEENIISSLPTKIDWEFAESKIINPSLDYLNGITYLSQQLPLSTSTGIERKTCVITSDHKLIVLDIDTIKKGIEGIRITGFPDFIENRWSNAGIRSYLKGTSQTPEFNDVFLKIYNELEDKIEFKDKRYYSLIACWIMASYFFPIFDAFPYIYLTGVKRTGKSKLLTATSLMAFNGRMAASMTTATLFRMAESNRSTLCIDELEGDKFSKDADFRSLMLSGYKKGIKVPRARKLVSGRQVVDEFAPYSPKMTVNLKGLDEVMEDRCITVIMERGTNHAKIDKMININNPLYPRIRDDLYLLCLDKCQVVQRQLDLVDNTWLNNKITEEDFVKRNQVVFEAFVGLKKSIGVELNEEKPIENTTNVHSNDIENINSNTTNTTNATNEHIHYIYITLQTLPNTTNILTARDRELSLPVLTIASLCHLDVYKDIYGLLCDVFVTKKEEDVAESAETTLLEKLLEFVSERKFYKISEISNIMVENGAAWMNTKWVGKAIKRLGISHTKRSVHGKAEVLLDPEDIKKKATDMGIDISEIDKEIVIHESNDEIVRRIIKEKSALTGAAPTDIVIEEAREKGVPNAEKIIQNLLREGILFEPKSGHIKIL